MKSTIILFCLAALLSGCASPHSIATHTAAMDRLRSALPYKTQIGNTHSMSTVVPAGSQQVVRPLPYARLQAGMRVVYWPYGYANPVCHFVGGRVGTDSWQTHGMNQASDLTTFGWLLTRENYIGVIY